MSKKLSQIISYVGYLWTFPLTAIGIVYATLFTIPGWYKFHGRRNHAIVWRVNESKAPTWLWSLWKRWAGHAIGQVVVVKHDPDRERGKVILVHEQQHVLQCMKLGVFQPVLYLLAIVAIRLGCSESSPYHDNPFEIDARRAAGQLIDMKD